MDRTATTGPSFVGETIETTVERMVAGGVGLAHSPGKTLFVAAAAPGDRVRVRIERDQGRVAHARIVELLEPSPERIEPPFPALAASGAAGFAHLRYPRPARGQGGDRPRRAPSHRRHRARCPARDHTVAARMGLPEPRRMALRPGPAGARLPRLRQPSRRRPAGRSPGHAGVGRRLCRPQRPGDGGAPRRRAVDDPGGDGRRRGVAPPQPGRRGAAGDRRRGGGRAVPLRCPLLLPGQRRLAGAAGGGGDAFRRRPSAESPALDLFCGVGLFTLPWRVATDG
jgi:predicted RNA-binding protein with TRAM domain